MLLFLTLALPSSVATDCVPGRSWLIGRIVVPFAALHLELLCGGTCAEQGLWDDSLCMGHGLMYSRKDCTTQGIAAARPESTFCAELSSCLGICGDSVSKHFGAGIRGVSLFPGLIGTFLVVSRFWCSHGRNQLTARQYSLVLAGGDRERPKCSHRTYVFRLPKTRALHRFWFCGEGPGGLSMALSLGTAKEHHGATWCHPYAGGG